MSLSNNSNLILFDINLADEEDIEDILDATISLASGEMAQGIFELLIQHPVFGDLLTDKILRLELNRVEANDDSSPAVLPSQTVL